MVPLLAPPWSKLFIRDQKWSSRTSTLGVFFGGGEGGGGVFVAAIVFKSFFLKLHMVTSIFLNIFVQDGSFLYVVANNRHKLNKFILEKVIIKKQFFDK